MVIIWCLWSFYYCVMHINMSAWAYKTPQINEIGHLALSSRFLRKTHSIKQPVQFKFQGSFLAVSSKVPVLVIVFENKVCCLVFFFYSACTWQREYTVHDDITYHLWIIAHIHERTWDGQYDDINWWYILPYCLHCGFYPFNISGSTGPQWCKLSRTELRMVVCDFCINVMMYFDFSGI